MYEKLGDKITSVEALAEALHIQKHQIPDLVLIPPRNGQIGNSPKKWWAYREQVRLNMNVYYQTSVLESLNKQLGIYAHVSKEDPEMVAYTPDNQAGEQDRQLRTTLGKLITKYYPSIKDEAVNDFVSTHKSELSDEIFWLDGDDIANIGYGPDSVGSCMSTSYSSREVIMRSTGGLAPALVYSMPNIRMAVLYDKEGKINARSLVREDKKQYIRVYGDALLTKRLHRNGYSLGDWQGIELKAIPIGSEYLMSYLDGRNAAGNRENASVAMLDDKLVVLTKEQVNAYYTRFRNYPAAGSTTAGKVKPSVVNSSDFIVTDGLTGQTYNLLTETVQFSNYAVVRNDTIEHVSTASDMTIYPLCSAYGTTAYCMDGNELVDYAGNKYYNTEKNLEQYSLVRLDAELYPNEQGLISLYNVLTTASGKRVKKADTYILLKEDGSRASIHASELTKQHVKLFAFRSKLVFAEPNAKFYLTPTKKKVHPVIHDVQITWDGKCCFERNIDSAYIFDELYYFEKNTKAGLREFLKQKLYKEAETGDTIADIKAYLRYYRGMIYNGPVRYVNSETLAPLSLQDCYTVADRALYNTRFNDSEFRTHSALTRAKQLCEYLAADAKAVEAPHYLAPQPVSAILPEPVIETV